MPLVFGCLNILLIYILRHCRRVGSHARKCHSLTQIYTYVRKCSMNHIVEDKMNQCLRTCCMCEIIYCIFPCCIIGLENMWILCLYLDMNLDIVLDLEYFIS